jgi:predicted transcriptional regulator
MPPTLLKLSAEIIAAFVLNNTVPIGELPALITSVHDAVARLGNPAVGSEKEMMASPAVPVRQSITRNYLICLEDGQKFKMLRRHLAGLGLTPDQYRDKWNLPKNYPMTAPAYAKRRAEIAKTTGLGRRTGESRGGRTSRVEQTTS